MSEEQSTIQDFEIKENFSTLFKRKDTVVDSIRKSMSEYGYDPTQPLILAVGTWTEKPILIDGYTRHQVATELNIAAIPTVTKSFDTEDDAFIYAIHLQKDRRNLSDAELYNLVELLDKKKTRGGSRNPHGRSGKSKVPSGTLDKNDDSSEPPTNQHEFTTSDIETTPGIKSSKLTSEKLGTSERKVARIRAIQSSDDEDIKESVKSGELSINKAEKVVQERKKQKKQSVAKLKMVYRIGSSWEWNPVSLDDDSEFILDEDMLLAPENDSPSNNMERNVIVSPEHDIFDSKVPTDWIDRILNICRKTPQWNYLFTTRNSERLTSFLFPENSWVGVIVDTRESAELALKYLPNINVQVRFLEIVGITGPDNEKEIKDLEIEDFSGIDWVIVDNNDCEYESQEIEFFTIARLTEVAIRSNCKVSWTGPLQLSKSPSNDLF